MKKNTTAHMAKVTGEACSDIMVTLTNAFGDDIEGGTRALVMVLSKIITDNSPCPYASMLNVMVAMKMHVEIMAAAHHEDHAEDDLTNAVMFDLLRGETKGNG